VDSSAPETFPSVGSGRPEENATAPVHGGRDGRRKRRTLVLVVSLGVLLAGLAGALVATGVFRPSSQPGPGPATPGPEPEPPPPSFAFTEIEVSGVPVGKARSRREVREAGEQIAAQLASFYQTAFLEPATWTGDLPEGAWELFANDLKERAMEEASSFSLAGVGGGLKAMDLERATLDVKLLVNAKGTMEAAIARVELQARATLQDGTSVEVTHDASLILRLPNSHWKVIGYPQAETRIEPPAGASPSPSGPGTPAPSPEES
jgi:hypothetical protein